MTTVSLKMPQDVVDDLKDLAPLFGFAGHESLIRAYIGQGMRKHETELEGASFDLLAASLRRHGIKEETIASTIEEMRLATA